MNCDETRRFLEADGDGELDLVRHLEIEAHLRDCGECSLRAQNLRDLHAVLNKSLPRYTASPELVKAIRASIHPPGKSARPTSRKTERISIFWTVQRIFGIAACLALAVLGGYRWGSVHAYQDRLIDDAVNDHLRSLQATHLTDVTSTDQHTVKPWFAGKLDFSPPVVDPAIAGFPLTGGRLDRIDRRPAAALVFSRRQHAINLFIWPIGDSPIVAGRLQRNGYHTESWHLNGFNFLAVSEISAEELTHFAEFFRSAQRE